MTIVLLLLVFMFLEMGIFVKTKYLRSRFSMESNDMMTALVTLKRIRKLK